MDNMTILCNIQWFFFLIHQGFFVLVPMVLLHHEVNMENIPPGYNHMIMLKNSIKSLIFSNNEDTTELV